MSPDTIFAAQMWTWPDAVIKRNAQGQVLLINSAFLSLYGGTVEAWAGNLITGWNNPPAPGTAVRFETRMISPIDANGQPMGEIVFDWIESAAADGTSLSIARNITHVQPSPGIPAATAPVIEDVPPAHVAASAAEHGTPAFESVMEQATQQAPSADAAIAQAVPYSEPAAGETAQPAAAASDTAAPHHVEETPHVPAAETFVHEMVEQEQAALAAASTSESVDPQPLPPMADTVPPVTGTVQTQTAEAGSMHAGPAETVPEPATSSLAQTADHVETPQAPAAEAPTQVPPVQSGEREYERRALPIEDDSAVLGNNWRDAVIAKAVGASGAQSSAEAAEAAALAMVQDGQTTRILLAEDNAINALLTRTLLEAEGCVVDTVEDGSLAIEAMKVKTYDLIFMDMRMPNMDGLEATRKIRNMDHRSKGLPIIALTANAFDDDRNACFDSGMNDFMTKPVSAEELSEMVAAWTGESAKEKLARMA